jgi:phage terminase large subunit-like protein
VRDVTEGRIPACKWVRLAVKRHLADRAREHDARYPYRFDEKAAAAVLGRMERYRHIKGKWARRGETITLGAWQCFFIGCVFGWKRKRDGLRRFREVYGEVPRKSAKSTMAALIGLEMLAHDGEHGAEVYAGAGTERQALEVFTPAKLMLERSPELRDEAGIEVWAKALVRPEDNSRFWRAPW